MTHRPARSVRPWVLAAGLLAAAPAARAMAHFPVRPVSADLYSGRWYEIARTPNTMQKHCQGATSDFRGLSAGTFTLVETCHRRTADGKAKVTRARGKIVSTSENTRFRISFFGGLIHQEYWILDHADDNSWAVMATPGGHYAWLLSRRPVLPAPVLAAALARVGALGYAPSRLVFPARGTG